MEVDRVEVSFGGFPVVGDFHEDGGDKAEATFWGGEDGDDTGSAADLFVNGFAEVGGTETFADGLGEGKDGKAFGEIFLHPGSELGGGFFVFQNGGGEQIAGGLEVWRIEEGADVGSDRDFHFLLGDVGLGVLLEVELATIPRHGREDGAGAHDTGGADFFVTGVDDEVGHGRDGAMTPSLKEGIELRGGATDLSGGDFQAAEFFEDFGDSAGGYALNIHFGDGNGEGAFAALASF